MEKIDLSSVPTINIDISKAETLNLADLVKKMSYLPLQLPEGVVLENIFKVVVDDSTILIMDGDIDRAERIFSFKRNGELNFILDKPGRGPGEYEHIYDFDLTDKSLVISSDKRIRFYDKDTGEFQKQSDVFKNYSLQMFAMLDQKIMVIDDGRYRRNNDRMQIRFYDLEQEQEISAAHPFKHHAMKTGHSFRYFFDANDTLSVMPLHSSVVYRIQSANNSFQIIPAYQFDFNGLWIPDELLEASYSNRPYFFDEVGKYIHTAEVFETNGFIYVFFRYLEEDYHLLYNKESGHQVITTDFDGNIGWLNKPVSTYHNEIINVIYPYQIEEQKDVNEELKKISAPLAEDTPILIFAEFED